MAGNSHELVLWRTEHSLLTIEELASAAGLQPEVIENYVGYGLIEPSPSTGSHPLFPVSSVEQLRRIVRLRGDLGVNLAGVAVILEMRERIENLQRELRRLRRRLGLEG